MHPLERLMDRLAGAAVLDRPVDVADRLWRPVVDPLPMRNLLSGTWLGHRLHPLLMIAPLGSMVSAGLLDLLGGRDSEAAADRLLGVAVLTAAPTTLAGWSDWTHATPSEKRLGLAHAGANVTAVLLSAASLRARKRGHRLTGKILSLLGLGAVGAGGYIGGHLSYVMGVGVSRTAFAESIDEWTDAVADADLPEGRPHRATVAGIDVLLVRRSVVGEGDAGGGRVEVTADGSGGTGAPGASAGSGRIDALLDRCNHLGCSLAEGRLEGDRVECRCHGSRFRLADGRALAGPAASAQPAFDTRVRDGRVEIRSRPPGFG